jgi:hypothetical protein
MIPILDFTYYNRRGKRADLYPDLFSIKKGGILLTAFMALLRTWEGYLTACMAKRKGYLSCGSYIISSVSISRIASKSFT